MAGGRWQTGIRIGVHVHSSVIAMKIGIRRRQRRRMRVADTRRLLELPFAGITQIRFEGYFSPAPLSTMQDP
jgi:hypothetical protein